MFKDNTRTLGIKRRWVAIISVLTALILVTTISYDAFGIAYAEGEGGQEGTEVSTEVSDEQKTDEAAQEDSQDGTGASDTESGESEASEDSGGSDGDNSAEGSSEDADGDITDKGSSEDGDASDADEKVEAKRTVKMPSVTSSSYIVMSGSTSEKVIEKYSTRKMQPGCMTLLMTAMITIDNMYNDQELTNTVKITEKLAGYGDEYREGETISVGDLLNAMLTGGSGQAAEALASYSATKRKIFIREMNSKALALGLLDTHFANPSGSWSTKQYSTAADCAVIMQAAMRYPLIREAFSLKTAETAALTGKQQRTVNIRSVNPLIAGKPSELYSFSQGGISGSLGEPVNAAQYAGAAVIDDMQLIVILMDSDSSKLAYEAKGLLDYADTKVTRNTIVKADKHVGNVRVRGGSITRVAAYTASKGFAYVPPEGSTDLVQTETVLFTGLEAPLKEGDKVGEFRISVADELKGTVDLVIKRDVPKGWFLSGFYISNAATVLIGVFIFLILALVLRILAVRRRRRRLRALRRERKIRELALQQMKMDEDRRKRNWYYSSSYEKFPPRTGDLRREALERAAAEQEKKR